MTPASSPARPARPPEDWVAVGVIRGAFGVHGALKVEPYTDVQSSVLNRLDQWRIEAPAAVAAQRLPFALPAQVTVQSRRQHSGLLVATIEPAITREQAMALKGAEVLVDRSLFPATEPDEYYWADLIGCAVSNPAGESLGQVLALDDNGAQAVLRLDSGILIPFVAAIILEVMPAEKRILADWSSDWL
jgi:16S rRNA processing protein RimM